MSKHALVTDFGISRMSGSGTSPTDKLAKVSTSYSTSLSGTYMYMAPELVKAMDNGHFQKPNFTTDIFALGATLAELLSTQRLYGEHCRDVVALLKRKAESALPSAAALVPAAYRDLIRRSLQNDPSRRPTAGEFLRDFLLCEAVKPDAIDIRASKSNNIAIWSLYFWRKPISITNTYLWAVNGLYLRPADSHTVT